MLPCLGNLWSLKQDFGDFIVGTSNAAVSAPASRPPQPPSWRRQVYFQGQVENDGEKQLLFQPLLVTPRARLYLDPLWVSCDPKDYMLLSLLSFLLHWDIGNLSPVWWDCQAFTCSRVKDKQHLVLSEKVLFSAVTVCKRWLALDQGSLGELWTAQLVMTASVYLD